MKKCGKLLILLAFFTCCATVGKAQEPLVVEYENSPPPQSIIAILIGLFTPDDFDFNGDGKRDIIVRVGNNLVVRTFSQPDNMVFNATDAGVSLDDYRCLGFHDIGGSPEKELVLVPKAFVFKDVLITSYYAVNNEFIPSYSWGATNGALSFYGVENTDGDPQSEILAVVQDEQFYVLGQGFTPGLTGEEPSVKSKAEKPSTKSMGLLNFEAQIIAPPNFRWPGNYTYIDPGSQDFDNDGIKDYGYLKMEGNGLECEIVSGADHTTLMNSVLSDQFSLNFTTLGYFDVTGEGYKHVMIGGSNTGSGLTDMEIILWLNPQTNEINTSLMPFLELGFRVVAIGNPFGMGGTPTTGIIMRHMTTGRVIVVGDGPGFQGGGTGGFTLPNGPEGGGSVAYSLNMVYESQVPVTLFMAPKGLYNDAELDANGDGTVDLPYLVLQDSIGNDMAGFTVLDRETFEPIWETTLPTVGPIDPVPFFHGFFDANGDGQKEIIYGAETVQTSDSQIHKPFGPGFQIMFIYDIDGDGYEEVIGSTPEGKAQVWSSHAFVSAIFEPDFAPQMGLSVLPNPSKGEVNFYWDQHPSSPTMIEVFDRQGVLVQQQRFDPTSNGETAFQIHLDQGLPNGLYIGRVRSANTTEAVRFVLQR